jgi:glycosyltransferase involved in cell wall biosynthesis
MIPKLSIVIPTYKRTHSLERLLDCLLKQDNKDLEIIIVDQNPQGFFTPAFFIKLQQFVYVYQNRPNTSLARNNGFKASTAPYILFLDDDLIPEPYFCSKGISVFNDFPLIRCFVPLVYPENEKEIWISNIKKKIISEYPGNKLIYSITDFISAAVFFERTYFGLSGGFDIHLFAFAKASEDVELFLRMQQRKLVLWFVSFLEIFHDETTSGGCEMRTAGYWITRKKNARAMAFRYRIHNKVRGKLSFTNIIQLSQSLIFNKKVLNSGICNMFKEIRLLSNSIKESRVFYNEYKNLYSKEFVNFLT